MIKIGLSGICYSGSCCKLIISGYGQTGIQALGEAFPDEGNHGDASAGRLWLPAKLKAKQRMTHPKEKKRAGRS